MDDGAICGAGRREVVGSGTVCTGNGYCTLVPPSVDVRAIVGRELLGIILWSCLL